MRLNIVILVEVAVLGLKLFETRIWAYYEMCNRFSYSIQDAKITKILESLLPDQIKVASHRLVCGVVTVDLFALEVGPVVFEVFVRFIQGDPEQLFEGK